jgi:NAD(P)-dependent dehydrogenase (short-subunit alcohol dehydrogenase family)
MLTKQSSIDYLEYGVRVISISPGWVKTDMGGLEAKYEVPESVKLILSLLENLPTHSTGIFVGEDGETYTLVKKRISLCTCLFPSKPLP